MSRGASHGEFSLAPGGMAKCRPATGLLPLAFVCLGCLLWPSFLVAELGESMRLEGRMAMRRGLECLLQWQTDNGSWGVRSPTNTAQAVMAVDMSGMAGEWEELRLAREKGNQWLENWLQLMPIREMAPDPFELVIVTRPMLRQRRLTQEQSRAARQILEKGTRQNDKDDDAGKNLPWILEGMALLKCSPETMSKWRQQGSSLQQLAAANSRDSGAVVAAALMLGSAEPGLSAKLAEAIKAKPSLIDDFNDLYWLTRVARNIYRQPNSALPDWQQLVMARLLNAQKGDGGWGDMQADRQQRINDTSLALQTMMFCLD